MLSEETPPSSPARTRADGSSITNYRARDSAGWTAEDPAWSREDGTWTKERGVYDNNRDSVALNKLVDHPSSSLRPRAGMERGIMVEHLYIRLYLFCQVEIFCDYKTRRPCVPCRLIFVSIDSEEFCFQFACVFDCKQLCFVSCFRVISSCFFRLDRYWTVFGLNWFYLVLAYNFIDPGRISC